MKEIILDKLRDNTSLTIMELNDLLGLTTIDEYKSLQNTLDEMVSDGILYYSDKKKKYLLLENSHLVKGTLSLNEKGFGFIIINKDTKDVYVNEKNINGAQDGDLVLFEYLNKDKERPEGKIIKTIKRNYEPLVGEVILVDGEYFVKPDRKGANIYIPRDNLNGAVEGHKVVVTPLKEGNRVGKITKIIGHKNDVGVDILSFVYEYNFSPSFPDEVVEELDDIPSYLTEEEINKELSSGRRDLRSEEIFTIDGSDTKDIDDAISLSKLDDGKYKLGVHIADVSYYVKEGTKLDDEAYFRGTSVYLVDRVLPMLPHKLSNGICSLNENEDRFAFSCEMIIDNKGDIGHYEIFKSIIRSRKKMTYEEVNKILEENTTSDDYKPFEKTLLLMNELSKILRKKMIRRGYIEFESTEAKIKVDENCHPTHIESRVQRSGEELIENFMIAANETVASSIYYKNLPGIYRVHDKPDEKRLGEFMKFLSLHGYVVNGKNKIDNPKDLQHILSQLEEVPEVRVLHDMAIRSQAKAVYSDINIGHFGLGSKCYSHFTSPIRRYPDLILHRLLKDYNYNYSDRIISERKEELPIECEHCSIREQEAQNCERDVDKMKKAEYMMDHIGEVYDGIISGVVEFGFFVELENTIEGLVKAESIKGDYYVFDNDLMALIGKKSKKKYSFGDKVKVKVIRADKDKSEIDFEIYDDEITK
ncbi:MAG: ribonuclease R [Bacilli bacterium]|nr:ribonuclease R [Bacilli bacterium]